MNTSKIFMAFAKGKETTDSAIVKRYTGVAPCYVVGVNRVGKDPYCQYSGHSAIIDPYGKTLAECNEDKECLLTAQIDMDTLEAFREKFPVLEDADDFVLTPRE